ncbi:DUF1573 domain-containing protein [Natranaerobius trueperi]|uniref:DUF1573 domain-containing protein n=1 Tax=Natranaerobius trueperi TaxID=759412 RepID=A0A226BZZ2_9FIRM|nr:DUF1573 domain-containing protein [Natranaerobius trueperi]OWZ84515.1 DUF1573 domain-containing protein [Natranaerobius trueperi]
MDTNETKCQELQKKVSGLLLRHKSVLDSVTKFQESTARVNRAAVKSATNCGCIQINAKKQTIPEKVSESSIEDYHDFLSTHMQGELCENCKEVVVREIGNHFFYLAALANSLDISLEEALEKETDKIDTLGFFNLS